MKVLKRILFLLMTAFYTFYAKRKLKSHGAGLHVNYFSAFTSNTTIGDDCHFNGLSVIGQGPLCIGDHFHSGSGILIITANHNYFSPNALPYDEIDISKEVTIGKNVWIGSRVIILPGTTIEDGVVAQAGAVLYGRIPKYTVVAGNPCKVIKKRDSERYDYLEKKGIYVGWKK